MSSTLKSFLIVTLFTLLACIKSKPSEENLDKVNWLLGYWERVNVKEDKSAHEHWEKVSDHEFRGWGISMKGSDTTFVENLKLVVQENSIFYIAEVAENPAPVYFRFTSVSETGFISENPEHDFPKKIEYKLKGDTLKAITSGEGREIKFIFMKSNR